MGKIAVLTGHTGCILELCASVDGQMVASAAADETIRIWKCCEQYKIGKKPTVNGKGHQALALARTIQSIRDHTVYSYSISDM